MDALIAVLVFVMIVFAVVIVVKNNATKTILDPLNEAEKPSEINITDEDILQMIKDGKKIQAVKMYRQLHNLGLKEAKDAVDAMARDL